MVKAIPASPAPTKICMVTTHQRLVFSKSIKGLQNGLITQGRYNQLVYRAMSVLEIPSFLYIITEMVITAT